MHLVRILALATGVACAGWSSVRGEGGDVLHRPLPEAITSFGAATLDGKLYVYSGHSETTASTPSGRWSRVVAPESHTPSSKGWRASAGSPY